MNPNSTPNAPSPSGPESLPGMPPAAELKSAPIEQAPAGAEAAPSPQLPPIPPAPNPGLAAAPGTSPAAQASPSQDYASPATADDVDVIEKEWVDQADRIIKQTGNDPYQEEEALENLQVEYLKKRYGKDVKKSD